MSPQVKVTWEETTKWVLRLAFTGLTYFGYLAYQSFDEMKRDMKTILLNNEKYVEKVNNLEGRVVKTENYIDKIRDGK